MTLSYPFDHFVIAPDREAGVGMTKKVKEDILEINIAKTEY